MVIAILIISVLILLKLFALDSSMSSIQNMLLEIQSELEKEEDNRPSSFEE